MSTKQSVDQRKQLALEALVSSKSLTEAARIAGLSRRTLYNYLYCDKEFAEAYQRICNELRADISERLDSSAETALSFITQVVESRGAPPAMRLQASCKLLDYLIRLQELDSKTRTNSRT